jgi:hypothetical protein
LAGKASEAAPCNQHCRIPPPHPLVKHANIQVCDQSSVSNVDGLVMARLDHGQHWAARELKIAYRFHLGILLYIGSSF